MSEGRAYRCKWEQTNGAFSVWVAKQPRFRGRGRNLQEAIEDLAGHICEATGDGEPCMSLFPLPPPHPADAPWIASDWCAISGRGDVVVAGNGDGLFADGWCKQCGRPRGDRTDKPVQAKRAGTGDVASAWWTHGSNGIHYHPVLVSERFIKVLSREERGCCEWREILMPRRSKVRYFECLPRHTIRDVAVRGWTLEGWRCPVCGHEFVLCSPSGAITWDGGEVHHWFSRASLDKHRKLFGADACSQLLIMPIQRGAEIIECPGTRGCDITAVGSVDSHMVRRRPRLPTLKESREEAADAVRKSVWGRR